MSKKYVPSGYQIINLDLMDKTVQVPFEPTTEDEKILWNILHKGNTVLPSKPILLGVKTAYLRFLGFGTIADSSITLISGLIGSSTSIIIQPNGNDLVFDVVEE